MNDFDADDHLTIEEAARFASLSRVAGSDDLAEERTVAALRRRGLLRRAGNPWRVPLLCLTAVAAALLIFVGGMTYGRHLALGQAEALSPEVQVQRAGTAYVAAMVRLSETASVDSVEAVAAGLEAGSTALRAAAFSAAQLLPGNAAVGRIHDGLELAASVPASNRALVWF